MGRNKFEEQLKKQLQGREIKPSESAWDSLSKQLEVSKTAKSSNFHWYGIAAGFIGILSISVLYLTIRGLSAGSETQVSNVKKEAIELLTKPEIVREDKIDEDDFDVATKEQEENTAQQRLSIQKIVIENLASEKTPSQNSTTNSLDSASEDAMVGLKGSERKVEKLAASLQTSEELINTKIAEVVAQVEQLEKENSAVTDAEIDVLLRNAQRQVLEDKIFRRDRSVDATALLADVEDELDRSFRDQIFDALKDGFLKVRTAVADRNN